MRPETKFTIFCMESYKIYKNMTGKQVAQLFEQYDVFAYLHEFYDVLHTTGSMFVNKDIDKYLQTRGVAI